MLLELDPLPDCELVHRYGPMREQFLEELEAKNQEASKEEIPTEVVVESETSRKYLEHKN